jgi:hypothetical protein
MEPIIQQLREYRERRQQRAERKYSRIVLRFDHPKPKDARTLDAVMKLLEIDEQELESDIQLIHQYRAYLGRKGERNPNIRGGKQDAENIRRMHPRLFLSLEKQQQKKSQDEPARGGAGDAKDHNNSAP